jgi:segregation and condensation protein B
MKARQDDLLLEVEAVLFAAGKPLSVKELASALAREDTGPVQKAVHALEEAYGGRASALEVRRVGDRYALQLRERFIPSVHAVTPVELAPRTVKALTLIAYHQPVLQSVLVRMMGDTAYEEVGRLRGLGLVRAEPKASTLELSTTRRFAEYFGLPSGRPEEIRRFLEQRLGVPPPTAPTVPPGPAGLTVPGEIPIEPVPPSVPTGGERLPTVPAGAT